MAAKCSCAPTDNHLIPNYIGEQLLIGDDILVEALEVSGEQVRLSIAAPKDVKVLRDELLEEGAEDFQWRGQTTAMVQSMSFIPHAVIHVGQLPDHLGHGVLSGRSTSSTGCRCCRMHQVELE